MVYISDTINIHKSKDKNIIGELYMEKFAPKDFKTLSNEELEELINNGKNYGAMFELAKRKEKEENDDSKEYAKQLFKSIISMCESSNSTIANVYLGRVYFYGKGVEKDVNKAKEYFEKAYKEHDINATVYLGFIYYYAKGAERDVSKALKYMTEAFDKERDKDAAYVIGCAYYHGKDEIKTDYIKAREYFEAAAEQGDEDSKFYLGKIYYHGKGVKADFEKAREYFEECALENDKEAMKYLGLIYYYGKGIDANYSIARGYFEKTLPDASSYYYLGKIYALGQLVEPNIYKAVEYLEKGKKLGNSECTLYLGEIYYKKYYGIQNFNIARNYFEDDKLAENEYALEVLAKMDYYGQGDEINYERAKNRFVKRAELLDNKEAQKYLACMYYFGRGFKKDVSKARVMFELLEKNKNVRANVAKLNSIQKDNFDSIKEFFELNVVENDYSPLFYLYQIYNEGIGTEKDEELANSYIYILVLTLLSSLIVLTIAIYGEDNAKLEDISDYLIYKRDELETIIDSLPESHPSKVLYNNIRKMGTFAFEVVRDICITAVSNYKKLEYVELNECKFTTEEDIERYAQKIISCYVGFEEIVKMDR